MTEHEVQNALYYHLRRRGYKYLAPNFYLRWEADMVAVDRQRLLTEYEIKVARSDFLNDRHKHEKHKAYLAARNVSGIPNRFVYVCTPGVAEPEEVPAFAGLVVVSSPRCFRSVKRAPSIHRTTLPDKVLVRLLGSMMYRYWKIRLDRNLQR